MSDEWMDDPEVVEKKLKEAGEKLRASKPAASEEELSPEKEEAEEVGFEDLDTDDDYDKAIRKMKQEEEKKSKKKPEEEEEEEAEVEEEGKKEEAEKGKKPGTEEEKAQAKLAQKVKEDLLKVVGQDAIAKIKGREYRIKDWTPQEVLFYLQKGFRADESMREADAIKKTAESQIASLSEKADLANRMLRGGSPEQPLRQPSEKVTVPEELKEDQYDDAQTKSLKVLGRTLLERLNKVEEQTQLQTLEQAEDRFFKEIDSHKEEYPLASPEEVVAVKAMHPRIPVSEIMAEGDKHYGCIEFVKKVFKHRPDIERQVYEEHVNRYLAGKKKAKVVPQKSTGTAQVSKGAPKVKFDEHFSFEQAEALAKAAIKQRQKEAEGEELF